MCEGAGHHIHLKLPLEAHVLVLAINLDASLQAITFPRAGIENPVPAANPAVAEAAH